MACAVCSQSVCLGDHFCSHCGSPQRQLQLANLDQEPFVISVFPDEVKESYLILSPQGQGDIEIRWELENDSLNTPWLRLPPTPETITCGREAHCRVIVYGGRLTTQSSPYAHLRLLHPTRQGSRLTSDRLWDRWCWETSRIRIEAQRLSPAFLVADRQRRNLGLISQVDRLPIDQVFRLGNGGDAPLDLNLSSSHPGLRLTQPQLTLSAGQTAGVSAELHLLDFEVDHKHQLTITVTSVEEDNSFDFLLDFELQHSQVELPVLGVDFGTSSSKVALLGEGQIQQVRLDGKDLFPSHLYLYPDGRMVIGDEATEFRGEPNYLRNLKSLMGTETHWVEVIDPHTGERSRHDLHTLIAGFLRRLFRKARDSADFERYVGKGVGTKDIRLVLTIPAGSTAAARTETQTVMTRILERLGFAEVSILVEPTAVSFLYASEDPEMIEGKRILVFDCGAGTTDISLLKVRLARDPQEGYFFRQFDILGEAGVPIGGNLFDVMLYDRLVLGLGPKSKEALRRSLWRQLHGETSALIIPDDFPGRRKIRSQHLLEAIRVTKEDLSRQWSSAQASFLVSCPQALDPSDPLVIDRPTLAKALRPQFDQLESLCSKVLHGASLCEDDIDRVYMVGGSSFLPPLKALLTRTFGNERIMGDSGRLTSISRGAVASASTRIRKVLTVDYLLRVPGLPDQLLVGAGAIYPTKEKARVFLAPTLPPFLIKFELIRRRSHLGTITLDKTTNEELLGELPVKVDRGPSREISLRYEIDPYGDLLISAEYRNQNELLSFALRYPRPQPKATKESSPKGQSMTKP